MHFQLQDISAIKLTSHKKIDQYLDAQHWRRKINHGGSWRWNSYSHDITKESIKNCHDAYDGLKTISDEYKLTTSYDCGYLYLKDLGNAEDFLNLSGIKVVQIKQVEIDRPENSMIIKSAKHDFRTYFKNQRIELENKQNLVNFLKDRNDIRLSPSFCEWISKHTNHRYLCDNYFIDHNDDGFLTMLCLVSPIKIKKTLTLLTE